MNRPEVRQVEGQKVESEREVTGWEAEELLKKYGYTEDYRQPSQQSKPQKKALTFEEMVKQEEEKRKVDEYERRRKKNSPKPKTFDGSNGYDSEVKWGSDDDLGFGFKIEISTDMKLPKY